MMAAGTSAHSSLLSWVLPNAVQERLRNWRWQYQLTGIRAKLVRQDLPPGVPPDQLRRQLAEAGFPLRPFSISPQAITRYVDQAGYARRSYYDSGRAPNAVEKYLEHYVALTLLQLSDQEVYIDVASDTSPLSDIARELKGVHAYQQDYAYPDGMRGNRIGGDACALPLPDGFADAMSLTCSYEHFEGDRDMAFLCEAERVLAPGGRLCILPLYLSSTYHIRTNPSLDITGLVFDDQAVVCCRRDVHVRHARQYDVANLLSRVASHRGALAMELYEIVDAASVDPSCYLRYAALFRKAESETISGAVR
ncbi:MAG: methyltransferase domain-containing protein [Nitrospirota bacterium]|nr:methyltransferase domain-containing protein [Nitrospirota bacterium]